MVLLNCPEQEIEDALGNIAACAEALFGAVGSLAMYKNESLLYLAPAAFVGRIIEVGGKVHDTIGTLKTAATAGKRKLGTAEETRVTRLLNKIDIGVAEGGVRRGIDEAVEVRATMLATAGWKHKGDYAEEDLKLCDVTEPIIRENAEFFTLRAEGEGEGDFKKLDVSKFGGKIERCGVKLNGAVVEGVVKFFVKATPKQYAAVVSLGLNNVAAHPSWRKIRTGARRRRLPGQTRRFSTRIGTRFTGRLSRASGWTGRKSWLPRRASRRTCGRDRRG